MNSDDRESRDPNTADEERRGALGGAAEDFPWEAGGSAGSWESPPAQNPQAHRGSGGERSEPGVAQPRTTNGMAVAGFVCALVALIPIPFLNFILWICGSVFSSIGLSRANKGAPRKGLAIAGLCVSLLGLVLMIVVLIGLAGFANS